MLKTGKRANGMGSLQQDKTLTISRSGTFDVNWQTHKGQCGYYGERTMSYHVTVKGREIDCPNGWLMDNNDIPNYFLETYSRVRDFQSCEAIASRAVDAFRAIASKHKAKPTYVRVAVSGIKNSEIVCEWEARRHHV